MEVIIGGPGSTGSSLLCQILNRHSNFFCGPESRILSLPQLYHDWDKYKGRLLKKAPFGLRPGAFHNITGIDLSGYPEIASSAKFRKLVLENNSFSHFTRQFFSEVLHQTSVKNWAEKTPNNIYCFDAFLKHFPNGKGIVTLRDPLEIIASQIARKKTCYSATAQCLLHYSLGLKWLESNDVLTIFFEELIGNPEKEIKRLCIFLGIPFEESMLVKSESDRRHKKTQIEGWRFDETDAIAEKVQSRFKQLSPELKKKILFFMNNIRIDQNFHSGDILDFDGLYRKINYVRPELNDVKNKQLKKELRSELREDKIFRIKKGQFNYIMNYPIQIN